MSHAISSMATRKIGRGIQWLKPKLDGGTPVLTGENGSVSGGSPQDISRNGKIDGGSP